MTSIEKVCNFFGTCSSRTPWCFHQGEKLLGQVA
jgi:hypothetical protein